MPPKTPGHTKTQERRKTKTVPVEDRIRRHFKSLCAQIDGSHFSNAIKTCDKILRIHPNDPDALQAKLFLLLHTERYNDALALIASDSGPKSKLFQKAYALYRLNKEEEAVTALDALKAEDEKQGGSGEMRGVMHLEAQLAYRQGAYQDSLNIYTTLLDTSPHQTPEQTDTSTNLSASQTHLDFISTGFLSSLSRHLTPADIDALEAGEACVDPSLAVSLPVIGVSAPKPKAPKKAPATGTGIPDPERWLKKSERSTFQSSAKKRRGGGGGGGGGGGATQGGAVVASEKEKAEGVVTGGGPAVGGGRGRRKR